MRLDHRIFLFAALVIALSTVFDAYSSRKAADIFGNTTYMTGNEYAAQVATLVDGVHDEPYLHVSYDDRYIYGDFNRDGLQDAAVILIENNGGNAEWYTLAFLINDGERLVHRASRVLDDRAIINAMQEKDGKVFIDMFIHQEGDCMAGPTKRVRTLYAYDGPKRWGEIEESSYQRLYANGADALQTIYDTPIPAQIRQTFDRTLQAGQACPADECTFALLGGGKPVGLFTKKFVLIQLGPDDSGGVSATLVFDGISNPFLLQMEDVGGGKYELRTMAELPGLLGGGLVRYLQEPAYRQYWL